MDIGLPDGANSLLHHLPAFEQEQSGNAAHLVTYGRRVVGSDVQLASLASVFARQRFHCGSYLPARRAPLRPEVGQDRRSRLKHFLVEPGIAENN
jgi:hypothetical protein